MSMKGGVLMAKWVLLLGLCFLLFFAGGRHECGVCNGGGTDEGECRCPRMIEWGMRNVKCGVMIRWM